ncbi:putative RNA recognition motif domain, nucleotide-binding alpha-beta plait domain superfamily [Helianthus annuus]|nr:putative RNA recognition motif domain, nucleotide-binding alpha-beta plait domain superfamily [Helianthus annuus]
MAGKDSDYRIFVGGLSWDVTERQLKDAFSRFGKIVDSQLVRQRDVANFRKEISTTKATVFLTFYDISAGFCLRHHWASPTDRSDGQHEGGGK